MSRRATSHVVGVALLVAVAVALAGGVWAAVAGVAPAEGPPPRAALSLSVSADDDRLAIRHRGGDALDVRTLRLQVTVDGTPLDHQPPVPFFAATGFESGPTGPFNAASDPTWTAGERATLAVAGTNAPAIRPGATVEVAVYAESGLVARLSATARRRSLADAPARPRASTAPRQHGSAPAWPRASMAPRSGSTVGCEGATLAALQGATPTARPAQLRLATSATVAMARGLPGWACMTRWSKRS